MYLFTLIFYLSRNAETKAVAKIIVVQICFSNTGVVHRIDVVSVK